MGFGSTFSKGGKRWKKVEKGGKRWKKVD